MREGGRYEITKGGKVRRVEAPTAERPPGGGAPDKGAQPIPGAPPPEAAETAPEAPPEAAAGAKSGGGKS